MDLIPPPPPKRDNASLMTVLALALLIALLALIAYLAASSWLAGVARADHDDGLANRPGYSVTEYPPPSVAIDGQALTGQGPAVRAAYQRFYGVRSDALWVDDHHRAIVAIEARHRIQSDPNAPGILAELWADGRSRARIDCGRRGRARPDVRLPGRLRTGLTVGPVLLWRGAR